MSKCDHYISGNFKDSFSRDRGLLSTQAYLFNKCFLLVENVSVILVWVEVYPSGSAFAFCEEGCKFEPLADCLGVVPLLILRRFMYDKD